MALQFHVHPVSSQVPSIVLLSLLSWACSAPGDAAGEVRHMHKRQGGSLTGGYRHKDRAIASIFTNEAR